MTSLLEITGDDIAIWSQQVEAPGLLPDLVRRLLLNTTPLSTISMSSHSGVRLPGWDGAVRANAETSFCPVDLSIWELTVEGEFAKLQADYAKRAAEPVPFDRQAVTYVAVSARQIGGRKLRWSAERRGESVWRDVRVLDADDLAAWLSQAPGVARWFAEKLHRPVVDLEDMETWLAAWRRRTQPMLPPEIVLGGRERRNLAEQVRAWARGATGEIPPLRVHADTRDEALAFVLAALAADESPEGEQIRTRLLVARSDSAFRWVRLSGADPQPIVVAAFDSVSASGPTILPIDGPLAVGTANVIRLPPIPYRRFAETLANTGMPKDDAGRVAEQSGGKLSTLQRLLGYVELPRWALGVSPPALFALLLVGSFEPDNAEDRDVLSLMATNADEVIGLCEHLRVSPDAPVQRDQRRFYRASWRWSSPSEAWRLLSSQIPAATLRAFEDAALLVLGERDPQLDLPPEKRFAAAIHGKVLRASTPLREGVARSLVLLAQADAALSTLHAPRRGSALAARVVHDLLPESWEAWASLSALLPLLASAAPETFIEQLEASLRLGEGGVAHLLVEEPPSGFGGGTPHTGLLWALETLGWSRHFMPRVASALARLAEHDDKIARRDRLSNRPAASLKLILRLDYPQTHAEAAERIAETQRRLVQTPDVGFRLLVEQLGSLGDFVLNHSAHVVDLSPFAPLSDEEQAKRRSAEWSQVVRAYVDMLLSYVGKDPARWAYFLEHARMVSDLGDDALARLESVRAEIDDGDGRLWHSLRLVISRSLADDDPMADRPLESGSVSPLQRWCRLYKDFEPTDIVARSSWLFAVQVVLPKPFDADREFAADFHEADALRKDAVEEICARPERLELLTKLATESVEPSRLGAALGVSTFAAELEPILFQQVPSEPLKRVVGGFVVTRHRALGGAWLEGNLRLMLDAGRTGEVVGALLAFGGFKPIWDIADRLGDEVRRAYWAGLEYATGATEADDFDRAIANLVDAGNITAAISCAVWGKEKVRPETVSIALSALADASSQELGRFARMGSGSYNLEQLMDRLEASPEANERYGGLLAKAEQMYSYMTREPKRPLRRVSAAFATNPGFFVDLVKALYRGKDDERTTLSEEQAEERARRAENAYRILDVWKGFPGQGLPTRESNEVLYQWALSVLRELGLVARSETGASEVARVLARAPGDEEVDWPCAASIKLLELDEFPALSSRLVIAKRNLRGTTSRSPEEGGKQERALAAKHRHNAELLRRKNSPRAAVMLDELAEDYERDAAQWDAEARTRMQRQGLEPDDLSALRSRVEPSPTLRAALSGAVHLKELHVEDFALFDRLEMSFQAPSSGLGQWVVLLGDNGRGKTTILRALALALGGANIAQSALVELKAPLVRIGRSVGRTTAVIGERRFSVRLSNDSTGASATSDVAAVAAPQLFAYGCRRSAGMSGAGSLDVASQFSDVTTLFRNSELYSARTWLKDLKLRALQDPKHDHVLQTVVRTLCSTGAGAGPDLALLPDIERLDVVGDEVWAIAPKLGGRIPLAALSDGYLTMLGWLADLMARLLHRFEQLNDEPPVGAFFEEVEGVVLVDEIDLHLHPRWQRGVIGALRRAFPRLSFVVTTHNPQTLLGAEPGEVFVLRERDGRQEAKQFNLPRGASTDRILTGEWFELAHAVDDETAALVEQHGEMLVNGTAEDAPERLELEAKLAGRYGTFADTAIDRIALEVAAQLKRSLRPKTPEERKKFRDEVRAAVQQQLDRRTGESKPPG